MKNKDIIKINKLIFKLVNILLILLVLIQVSRAEGYNRKNWRHWVDRDRDCLNTRHEVLLTTSLVKPTFNKSGCIVKSGKWYDPYSGKYYTNARNLDIDHIVALKEAFLSGGNKWTKKQKEIFANDIENLIPVVTRENRQKGAKDFVEWLPSNKEYHCKYINRFISIKKKYNLIMDKKEIKHIFNSDCSFIFINK